MRCPHCLVTYHAEVARVTIGNDFESQYLLLSTSCPGCKRLILTLRRSFVRQSQSDRGGGSYSHHSDQLCYPKGISRAPLGSEVPSEFAEDYKEACMVLPDSPKASAALSRRCLQHLLREKAVVKKGNLADEIQQVIDSGKLPSQLAESLDAIRNIGNFAAHPIKSKSTGEILEVEPGEAEWNLDVLEALFDFYFTQPAKLKAKRDALNAKLKEAGKPGMK